MNAAAEGRDGLLTETPDQFGAYPKLTREQIEVLKRHGRKRPTSEGAVLFREGEPFGEFLVVLAGLVEVVHDYEGPDERTVAVHGPGRFLGELGLLEGQAAFYSAIVREPGEVLAVPVDRLRAIVGGDPVVGDLILRAYLGRRALLIGLGAGFRILGSCYSPDTRRLREFAARNRLPHRWIDLERDKDAEELLRRFGVRPEETPVVIWKGEVLRNPGNAELARVIGLPAPSPEVTQCDVLVIGAGPAGLATSVYGASDGLVTVTVDGIAAGGQAGTSSRIENYLGFPSGISGAELIERSVLQAHKFGARLTIPAEATGLEACDGHYVVAFADGTTIETSTVVLALGARFRRLRVPGIERFEGSCVYYAATLHEAHMCRTDPIAVVGGGNSAGQGVLFLSRYVPHTHLIVRGGDLNQDMSRYLVDQVERNPKITVLVNSEVIETRGDGVLETLVVRNNVSGEVHEIQGRALFVFIGAAPPTDWVKDVIALDDEGFVLTGPDAQARAEAGEWAPLGRAPMLLETTRPGVFAVGDVRSGSVKRVASAAGEGAIAVRLVHEHQAQEGNLVRTVVSGVEYRLVPGQQPGAGPSSQ
ncbi:FAD-dependent oxidoreductase [Streptomyces sp. NBC_01167]|uniref:FAD-dependent oxidoreductase n=1 Tax=Streptomyces sp. NBC_01167 TaxID=2903756 RepID=UPI00386E49A2|nr:FAD-dependent oxidoreductase [Streptomyces sp. NBC_01167]